MSKCTVTPNIYRPFVNYDDASPRNKDNLNKDNIAPSPSPSSSPTTE